MNPSTNSRILSLRYDGTCAVCTCALPRGTQAWWFPGTKKIVCFLCKPQPNQDANAVAQPVQEAVTDVASEESEVGEVHVEFDQSPISEERRDAPPLVFDGEAGASARREGERRRAKRERQTLERHPHLGKLISAASDEPQSIRSWAKGAVGEESLGAQLTKLASERLVVLHDRRVPGSRANIDHIVIAPAGVFVIDAKHYSGRVEKRDLGGWFNSDLRLYVGRRDCTKLALGSEDQAEVVRDAVSRLGFADIPVRPVLCFVGAEWGMFASPFKWGSVLVTRPKLLCDLLKTEVEVETAAIQETARHLVSALPRA